MTSFAAYQNEIYLQGLGGTVPPFTTDPDALESSARVEARTGPVLVRGGRRGLRRHRAGEP